MACVQQIRTSCESDYSEKEKTLCKDSHGRVSSEHIKHGHKSDAYASEGGYKAVGANGHQICNSAAPNKHSGHDAPSSGHLSLTEKVTGLFSSKKNHQDSGCNTHGHQTSSHGNHGHIVPGHGTQANQTCSNGTYGHIVQGHGTQAHQNPHHGGHSSSGCNSHGHNHHKVSKKESYEFEEKKEYKSCKTGGHKKVEKKIKKKSSYKSSSDSESDKEHC